MNLHACGEATALRMAMGKQMAITTCKALLYIETFTAQYFSTFEHLSLRNNANVDKYLCPKVTG